MMDQEANRAPRVHQVRLVKRERKELRDSLECPVQMDLM